jgi:hypothetical protein
MAFPFRASCAIKPCFPFLTLTFKLHPGRHVSCTNKQILKDDYDSTSLFSFLLDHFLLFSMASFSPAPYPTATSGTLSLPYPPPPTGGIYSDVSPVDPSPSDTILSYPQSTPTSRAGFPDDSSVVTLDSTILSAIIETSSPTPPVAALPSTSFRETKNLTPLAGYIGRFIQSSQTPVTELLTIWLAGCVIGGLAILAGLVTIWYYCWRRRYANLKKDRCLFDREKMVKQPSRLSRVFTTVSRNQNRASVETRRMAPYSGYSDVRGVLPATQTWQHQQPRSDRHNNGFESGGRVEAGNRMVRFLSSCQPLRI